MTFHAQDRANVAVNAFDDSENGDLERLRELILGADYEALQALKRRLGNQDNYTESVAEVLSEAISRRSQRDNSLTTALMPNVEEAIQISVRKDSRPLVEAIFPIIGPAIRKSISEAFNDMLKNINDIVEQSLSIRSLKWRLEAKRTGKTYAEIALLRTLTFQVEQVFLIHRETGLLLQHLVSEKAVINDPDMVSAMLTAIQDFVTDSFNVKEAKNLHSLNLGELTVLIEQGPRAVIAAVVIGNPPADMGLTLRETVEQLHANLGRELQAFDGDSTAFSDAIPLLQHCLRSQRQEKKTQTKPGFLAWFFLVAILFALGYWGVHSYRQQREWQQVLASVVDEPGYVVLSSRRDNGVYEVRGLRDPLARPLDEVVTLNPSDGLRVHWYWQPFLSMDEAFVRARIESIISPPDGVEMTFTNGVLSFQGEARQSWIDSVRLRADLIAGVSTTDFSELISTDRYRQQFMDSRQQLEAIHVYFESGAIAVSDVEFDKIREASRVIAALFSSAQPVELAFRVELLGYSDPLGTPEANRLISQQRADYVLNNLFGGPYNKDLFIARGLGGPADSRSSPVATDDMAEMRRVSFRVVLDSQAVTVP